MQIRVRPGAGRTRDGGRYGNDALVVAVQAPAVDGRATSAALKALAKALGCRAAEVSVVTGATSRTKVVQIPDEAAAVFRQLLDH